MEKLAKLKPFFDKPFGNVTAGNSSQITDGAALLILASEAAVKQYNLPVLARIVDTQWAALPPEIMGLGPVHAITPLLIRNKMKLDDVNYYEINEAFAAQVIACFKAWEDKTYCTQALGLQDAFGSIDQDTVNIDGGAIAVGHPIGASGARVVLHLAHILKRQRARYGVASLCIGGGQGGAMLIENINA
jgi:acetyl-CoA C-acetyltransferase